MTHEEFKKILNDTIDEIRATLLIKSDEYSDSEDKLKNFKETAALLECTPEQALYGFVAKHIVALNKFIKINTATKEQWLEKTGDIICYMILLRGLLKERNAI